VFVRTNFDKYHPGYFGKVGMRHFHLTRNAQWNPTINVDKLWTLVPEEHKKDLKENSQVVPVIDVLHHGFSKVLGNGRFVLTAGSLRVTWDLGFTRLPKLPMIVKARFVSETAE
jgi:large subunit ribosomal protein L27Ae